MKKGRLFERSEFLPFSRRCGRSSSVGAALIFSFGTFLLHQGKRKVLIHYKSPTSSPLRAPSDFEELLQFVRDARFERMGAFAYSEEEGTYSAGHYADDVPDEVKQRRLDALMSEQEEISLEVNRAKVGHNVRVIIDREEADYYVGRTEYDSPEVDPEVLIEKTKPLVIGEFYDATITSVQPFELFAVV